VRKFKIKSYCKVNLFLRIGKKFKNKYHSLASLITFCKIYDLISVSSIEGHKDKIIFSGKFKNGININSNIVTKVLKLLRDNNLLINKVYKINIKKNVPHGSGLGGGSSNAADLLNFFNSKMKLKLGKKKINKFANTIGFDVPICLEKKNTFLTGRKNEILRLKKNFKLNLLIVYPNIICSTKKIYRINKKKSLLKSKSLNFFNNKKIINNLAQECNDLEHAACKTHPKIGNIINFIKMQKGCYFSRITGSGSASIGIFSNMNNAINAKRMIKLKYPKYWCAVSKTM
tara:strand:- start:16528 stop:17388 length:861 start_codon:yes stop_codon:yes gene_type:complete